MKNLMKVFKNIDEYNNIKCDLNKKSVSFVVNEKEVKYYEKCMTDDDFNVRQIVVTTEENQEVFVIDSYVIGNVEYLYVDGVKTDLTNDGTVFIKSIGEHNVDLKLNITNEIIGYGYFLFNVCENTRSFDLTNFDFRQFTGNDCYCIFQHCTNLESIKLGKYGYSETEGVLFQTGYAFEFVGGSFTVFVCESLKERWGNKTKYYNYLGFEEGYVEYYNCEEE